MDGRINPSGLIIAGIGFLLTRFTVTLAIYDDPFRFYLAGVVPLVLGLGLAAFGVAMTVADVDAALVRTTALWCLAGTGAMVVLVGLTLAGSVTTGLTPVDIRSQAYLSNFLIGGSIGGTFTGLYAARNRRQRVELRQQADRLDVLNQFLRHEILNSLTAIRGFSAFSERSRQDAAAVIDTHSDSIEQTIEEVKFLTRTARSNGPAVGPLEIHACLEESIERVRAQYPDARITFDPDGEETYVRASEQIERAFVHLVENATVYASGEESPVEVAVRTTADTVRISIADDGPGLPTDQQRLLEEGDLGSFDDPGTGFGLNIVRFLVESVHGSIETRVGADGTTVTVILPRSETDQFGLDPSPSRLAGFRPSLPHLLVTLGVAVLAGVSYGLVAELLGGSVSGIGVFYGANSSVVGWITHEFHSVVFGFVFAGLVSLAPERYRDSIPAYSAIALGWALVLWFVAAGFVAPIWLGLLGISAPIPNLSVVLLVTHLTWGLTLGPLTALGYRYVTPWLQRRRP